MSDAEVVLAELQALICQAFDRFRTRRPEQGVPRCTCFLFIAAITCSSGMVEKFEMQSVHDSAWGPVILRLV